MRWSGRETHCHEQIDRTYQTSMHYNLQKKTVRWVFAATSTAHPLHPAYSVPPRVLRLGDCSVKILLTLLLIEYGGGSHTLPARRPVRVLRETLAAPVPATLMRNVTIVATADRPTSPRRHSARPRLRSRRLTRPCRGRSGQLTGRRPRPARLPLPARGRGRGGCRSGLVFDRNGSTAAEE